MRMGEQAGERMRLRRVGGMHRTRMGASLPEGIRGGGWAVYDF